MKRIVCLVLVLLCVLPLVACGTISPIPGLNNSLSSKEETTDPSNDGMDSIKAQYESEINVLKDSIEALQEEKKQQQTEIESLKKAKTEGEYKIKELTIQIADLENEKTQNEQAVSSLTAQITELEAAKTQNEQKITDLNTQIANLQADQAQKAEEIVGLKAQITELEANKTQKEQEISDLKTQISVLTATHTQKEQEISNLRTQISMLVESVAELTLKISEQDEEMESLIEDYENRIAELESQLKDKDVTTEPVPEPEPDPDIEDLDGYIYKAYVRVRTGNTAFYCEDFWVENVSADALSYAVYNRNRDVEDLYNCRIRQYDSEGSQYGAMTRFYFNDEKYELAILLATDAASCATANLLQNIYSLDNIDLSHDTYDQNSVQQFTMGGKLHYLSGDMNISTMDSAAVTIFNPDLFAKYDFVAACGNESYDNLYEMVAEGTWTVSAMMEMAEIASVEHSYPWGDQLVAADGDTVGYLSYAATPMYYWYGCGARVSELDDDGYPSLVFGAPGSNSEDVFNFLFGQINNQQPGKEWIPNGGGGYRNSEFMTDNLLFTDIILWDVRKVLHPQNKARYGILPIPKYNEEQSRYYDVVYWPYGTVHLWSVPTKCSDIDKASFLFHEMAVYSNAIDGTMDAYFVKALELSVARDAGSRATLKIVRDSVTYDIFLLYNWGDFIQRLVEDIDTAAANEYGNRVTAANLDAAVADMELTLERFKNPTAPKQEDAS